MAHYRSVIMFGQFVCICQHDNGRLDFIVSHDAPTEEEKTMQEFSPATLPTERLSYGSHRD